MTTRPTNAGAVVMPSKIAVGDVRQTTHPSSDCAALPPCAGQSLRHHGGDPTPLPTTEKNAARNLSGGNRAGALGASGRNTMTGVTNLNPITVSVADAMAMSGLSRQTLYRRMATKELETITIGRRRLIPVVSLKKLLGAE